jgi:uncharacterized membrane protein YvbJ
MTAAVTCRTCGADPRAGARFCDACGATYLDYRDRYRKMATEVDFEGHMAIAEAMP